MKASTEIHWNLFTIEIISYEKFMNHMKSNAGFINKSRKTFVYSHDYIYHDRMQKQITIIFIFYAYFR